MIQSIGDGAVCLYCGLIDVRPSDPTFQKLIPGQVVSREIDECLEIVGQGHTFRFVSEGDWEVSQLYCRVPFLVDSGDLEFLDENVYIIYAIVDTTLNNAFCYFFTVDTNLKRVLMGINKKFFKNIFTNFFIELNQKDF